VISSLVLNWWYTAAFVAESVGDHLQRRTADTVIGEQVQRGDEDAVCTAVRGIEPSHPISAEATQAE
jgi:hypothetical protein